MGNIIFGSSYKCLLYLQYRNRKDEGDLYQCERCQSYCDGFDELQVHMLTVHLDDDDQEVKNAVMASSQ